MRPPVLLATVLSFGCALAWYVSRGGLQTGESDKMKLQRESGQQAHSALGTVLIDDENEPMSPGIIIIGRNPKRANNGHESHSDGHESHSDGHDSHSDETPSPGSHFLGLGVLEIPGFDVGDDEDM
jgi:hypothetical protein